MAKPLTEDQVELKEYIQKLCDLEDDELTEWETNFVERLSHLPVQSLSQKQVEVIRELYMRCC